MQFKINLLIGLVLIVLFVGLIILISPTKQVGSQQQVGTAKITVIPKENAKTMGIGKIIDYITSKEEVLKSFNIF